MKTINTNNTLGFSLYILGIAWAIITLTGVIALPLVIFTVAFFLLGNLFLPFEQVINEFKPRKKETPNIAQPQQQHAHV